MGVLANDVSGLPRHISDVVNMVPAGIKDGLKAALLEYTVSFPREKTWVQENAGVPSLIIRFDFTIVKDKLQIYRVDGSPRGIGVAAGFVGNAYFNNVFREVRSTWPSDLQIITSANRKKKYAEDCLWAANKISTPEEWNGGPVLVRSGTINESFFKFEPYSITIFNPHNIWRCGEERVLWWKVREPEGLPSDGEAFVAKVTPHSHWSGIKIFDPLQRNGRCTLRSIKDMLYEYGEICCQPFHSPMETGDARYPFMGYRVYYGFDLTKRIWKYLSGFWSGFSDTRKYEQDDGVVGVLY